MAIYHHSVSVIKRSSGKSAVAGAAYRAGEKIEDRRTGIAHDYTKKSGVNHSEIIAPVPATGENIWLTDRAQLWNRVEANEKRHDAQLAREVNIAIPIELDQNEQIALVREYVKTNYVERGMIADVNFHDLESNNPHAHIMITMRDLIVADGKVEFGNKNREWNSKDLLLEQRQSWETLANKYLAAAGYDVRIDCRSLAEQEIDRIPQIHLGKDATAMRRQGIPTERGDRYDQIDLANAELRAQLEEIYSIENEISNLEAQAEVIKTEDDLGNSIDRLLERWGQRVYYPADVGLTFYRDQNNSIHIYVGGERESRIYTFKDKNNDNNWINTFKNKKESERYTLDNLAKIVDEQHQKFDIGRIESLKLDRHERHLLSNFSDWEGLEVTEGAKISALREKARPAIDDERAENLCKWLSQVPELALNSGEITKTFMIGNLQTEISVSDNPNSVYTSYIFTDLERDCQPLEIRLNRNCFENCYGEITPSVERVLAEIEHSIAQGCNDLSQILNPPITRPESTWKEISTKEEQEEHRQMLAEHDRQLLPNYLPFPPQEQKSPEQEDREREARLEARRLANRADNERVRLAREEAASQRELEAARQQLESPAAITEVEPPVESLPQTYMPTRLELVNWYRASSEEDRQKIAALGQQLKTGYMLQDFMQGQPEPETLPDEFQSTTVSISLTDKQRFDQKLAVWQQQKQQTPLGKFIERAKELAAQDPTGQQTFETMKARRTLEDIAKEDPINRAGLKILNKQLITNYVNKTTDAENLNKLIVKLEQIRDNPEHYQNVERQQEIEQQNASLRTNNRDRGGRGR